MMKYCLLLWSEMITLSMAMLPLIMSLVLLYPLQGYLELASARLSMGASRINSSLLDLKPHSAATTLEIDHREG